MLKRILLLLLLAPHIVLAQTVSTVANVRASGDIAVAANGDIYITDFGNPSLKNGTTIVKIDSNGQESVFASNLARAPSGIVIGNDGEVYVATYTGGKIYSISPTGEVTQIATANGPVGLALDENQKLYVAECNINRISLVDNNNLTVIASNQGLSCPNGLVRGHDNALYAVNFGNGGMYRVGLDGSVSLFATIPGGGNGHVEYYDGLYYVTARAAHQIYQVDINGKVNLLAGTGVDGNQDGDASAATFSRPNGLGISSDGNNLYITGNSNFNSSTLAIRKIELQKEVLGGTITINSGLTGTWYNPQTPGQGILFDINDDSHLFFGAWFTYDFNNSNKQIGTSEHRWFTLQGEFSNNQVVMPIFNTTGGIFDKPTLTNSQIVGDVSISFSSCTQGKIDYAFDDSFVNLTGEFEIVRLTPDAYCQSIIDDIPDKQITIQYIGNDGIYVSDGGEGFLIDAIGDFGSFFINVPTTLQNSIINIDSPYDLTKAVLVTHGHSDHYNITPIKNFINSISSAQLIIDSQSRGNFTSLGNHVENINLARFSSDTRQIGNSTITTISTRHFNQFGNDFSNVENYAYLLEISGKRIVHLGDIDFANDNFQAVVDATNGNVDVLIIPAFNTLLNQGNANLITQFFPNAQVIAAHLRSNNQSDINNINTFFPNAIIFDQPLKSIEL